MARLAPSLSPRDDLALLIVKTRGLQAQGGDSVSRFGPENCRNPVRLRDG
jgi:hypothetical protein